MNNHYQEEPIHQIGCIQPHGVLLVLKEPELKIIQASQNIADHLGILTEELLGKNLDTLLNENQINKINQYLEKKEFQGVSCLELTVTTQKDEKLSYLGNIHRYDQVLLLELERYIHQEDISLIDFYQGSQISIDQIKNNLTFEEICQISAQEIRKISRFDRVMIYQFDHDWHGKVIAESKIENIESYLGLHFPAEDIPPISRHLFSLQPLRLIPDINYQPIGLLPANNPITENRLDLSYSLLRGVSPIHIEYLRNMGVAASMTISLLKDGQLWGLIACHHKTPKFVSPGIRIACKSLAKILKLELTNLLKTGDFQYNLHIQETEKKLLESISTSEDFLNGLVEQKINILGLFKANGAAIYLEDDYETVGECPDKKQVLDLIKWLHKKYDQPIFYTNNLPNIYTKSEAYKSVASGILVIILCNNPCQYILWFRPEEKQIVNWAGSPNEIVHIDENKKLHPRNSFKQWEEVVRGKSLPWQPVEIEAALELRKSILEIGFQQMNKVSKFNHELKQKNQDLDAFAYIASHDLKEPLRGIYNYANFLLEDYSDRLDDNGVYQLETLVRLSKKMGDLLDSLLEYSRLGRVDFSYEEVNLNEVIEQVLDMIKGRWEENSVTLNIPRFLPTIKADSARLHDLYMNLLSNSIKYNDKEEKIIEIGYFTPEEMASSFSKPKLDELNQPHLIFYVSDNGIGISSEHKSKIFQIFKRLHPPEHYGGGTGIGLTIVQKIIERHRGYIWIDSIVDQGTTFYFTLTQ
ncbi:probable phytochrome [Crocosphaera subtropica ATCC 51142]|uniref:histidine kinase n=1 Tax=Crocosphaera subtropica (strain ATCC 51142 / BH68) TaxID=43989 RepID=B1X1N1_CROS5|nr:ATP-binding protein [Crocosphaera subtropica]ACB53061.1 probable phytochrome [Crocosphaera subtropica ATCC 51142]